MFGASKSGKAVAAAAATDPQFNYVTALFNGDGTNGAQNNTFLDSSTNNFTMTRVGTPTQGSAAPFGPNWSNYFSGVSDSLAVTSPSIVIGTADFTIEFWFYYSNADSTRFDFTDGSWQLYRYLDNSLNYLYGGTNRVIVSGFNLATYGNKWVHFAASRNSGTVKIYLNGTQVNTFTDSSSYSITSLTLAYNAGAGAGTGLKGYMSNFRIVNGTGLYSSAFTPPTAPLTAVTGTSLLTCQSPYFKDNSTNNFALSVSGTPSVQRFSPFNNTASYSPSVYGGSMYFDGTGNYLSLPANSAFNFGTSNLTMEAWIYPTTVSGNIAVFSFAGDIMLFGTQGGVVIWYVNGIASGWSGNTQTVVANQWSHIACVRNGTTCSFYLNGVASTGTSTHSESLGSSSAVFSVGYRSGFSNFTGYISNFRVVNGTALYTSNFTPPTAPLTAITNTSLLLSGTNAGVYDGAMITTVSTVGTAQISTTQKKYGTGSMYFPGSSNLLTPQVTPNLQVRTGDFTVELWVYHTATGAYTGYFWGGTSGLVLRKTNTETLELSQDGVASVVVSTATIPANQWVYITATRSGTTIRIFINGTVVGTTTSSADFNGTNPPTIGSISAIAGYYMVGYIDDFRFTKGYARYTANFTPPTAALPTF
jgi:hypothetical protein